MARGPSNLERALELTRQSLERELRVIDLAGEVAGVAGRAMDVSLAAIGLARTLIEQRPREEDNRALNPAELEALAQQFPQWAVCVGTNGGEACKTYSRQLDGVDTSQEVDRDIMLRFTDPEYFDGPLLRALDGKSGTGDLSGFHFVVTATEAGPITVNDFSRLAAAEQYLQAEGLVTPPETPPVAPA